MSEFLKQIPEWAHNLPHVLAAQVLKDEYPDQLGMAEIAQLAALYYLLNLPSTGGQHSSSRKKPQKLPLDRYIRQLGDSMIRANHSPQDVGAITAAILDKYHS